VARFPPPWSFSRAHHDSRRIAFQTTSSPATPSSTSTSGPPAPTSRGAPPRACTPRRARC
jgi:hypothetical protein